MLSNSKRNYLCDYNIATTHPDLFMRTYFLTAQSSFCDCNEVSATCIKTFSAATISFGCRMSTLKNLPLTLTFNFLKTSKLNLTMQFQWQYMMHGLLCTIMSFAKRFHYYLLYTLELFHQHFEEKNWMLVLVMAPRFTLSGILCKYIQHKYSDQWLPVCHSLLSNLVVDFAGCFSDYSHSS